MELLENRKRVSMVCRRNACVGDAKCKNQLKPGKNGRKKPKKRAEQSQGFLTWHEKSDVSYRRNADSGDQVDGKDLVDWPGDRVDEPRDTCRATCSQTKWSNSKSTKTKTVGISSRVTWSVWRELVEQCEGIFTCDAAVLLTGVTWYVNFWLDPRFC